MLVRLCHSHGGTAVYAFLELRTLSFLQCSCRQFVCRLVELAKKSASVFDIANVLSGSSIFQHHEALKALNGYTRGRTGIIELPEALLQAIFVAGEREMLLLSSFTRFHAASRSDHISFVIGLCDALFALTAHSSEDTKILRRITREYATIRDFTRERDVIFVRCIIERLMTRRSRQRILGEFAAETLFVMLDLICESRESAWEDAFALHVLHNVNSSGLHKVLTRLVAQSSKHGDLHDVSVGMDLDSSVGSRSAPGNADADEEWEASLHCSARNLLQECT
eukprot:TRINITY_DN38480_c0_g1_i1.p1 TRINITY_DN38480_c0_g1~~TRINITY_DN38480_c0_g1_i1.p1  ORF type:complete len:281 (-),score=32.41 TRINITY_DN38480_c0_g1_i1:38-880(-)